jgi:hypothetical protein
MEIRPPPYPEYKVQWSAPASEYRVTIWEQPDVAEFGELVGWGEMTFDLAGVADVHEALRWAERQLAANEGPYSRSGDAVRDREYVLSVKVPGEDRFVQIAGWDPSRNPRSANLRRVERAS